MKWSKKLKSTAEKKKNEKVKINWYQNYPISWFQNIQCWPTIPEHQKDDINRAGNSWTGRFPSREMRSILSEGQLDWWKWFQGYWLNLWLMMVSVAMGWFFFFFFCFKEAIKQQGNGIKWILTLYMGACNHTRG